MNLPASFEDYRWLLGDEGLRWLEEAGDQANGLVRLTARLRKHLTAARCHVLLEQAALRQRAKRKFPAAERMFFTSLGLEQATDAWVAVYKSARFPRGAPLVDFCCGIGGDLLALASQGSSVGIDRNPIATLLAEANLAAAQAITSSPLYGTIKTGDVEAASLLGVAAWHIDPDRRPQGRRTTRVDLHEPGTATIDQLLSVCGAAAVKLAPAAELPMHWQRAAELEWISRGGECRQLVAWFGPLARDPGHRSASILREDRRIQDKNGGAPGFRFEAPSMVRSVVGDAQTPIPIASGLGRYLAEPDPAVLASDLTGALAVERKLAAISPGNVYLTGDGLIPDAALAWFEIADVMPYDVKRLKAYLRERGFGRLEIKKRGVSHEPAQIRRELRVSGDNEATVFITRLGQAVTAIIARRLSI